MTSSASVPSFLVPGLLIYAAGDIAFTLACGRGYFGRTPVELILLLLALPVFGLIANGILWWRRRKSAISRASLVGSAAILSGLIVFHAVMINLWLGAI